MNHPTCEPVTVLKTRNLKHNYFSMTLGPYSRAPHCAPGQFLQIQLPSTDLFFRRPMSVASADAERGLVEIIFKVFGRGTTILSKYGRGDRVNILGPLGNRFKRPGKNERALLIGGGVGFPPLLYFASELVESGFEPGQIEFFYGGRTSGEIVERSRIKKLGVNFHPVTDDGSFGYKGLVTEAVEDWMSSHDSKKLRIYSCGPEPMLKATDELGVKHGIPGQLSLEAPMPCGVGICLGCVVPLREGGHARVCCEGPVFDIGEVVL